MYNLIFYFIFNQQINKGRSRGFARFNGSLIVYVALLIHVFLILEIIKKFFHNKMDIKFLTENKTLEFIFFSLCILLLYSYYTPKRIEAITNKYAMSSLLENYGGVITICLIFIPLLIFIGFLNS